MNFYSRLRLTLIFTVMAGAFLFQACAPTEDPSNFCSGGNLTLQNVSNIVSEMSLRNRNDTLLVTFKKGGFIYDAQHLFGRTLKQHWRQFDIAQGLIEDQSLLKEMMGDGRIIGIEQNNNTHILQPMPPSQCPRPGVGSDSVPWGVAEIHAPQAWRSDSQTTFFGSGVNVAVFDTGIDPNHPDLRGRVVGGVNFIPADGVPRSGAPINEDAWEDDHGHGTAVAGVIGARANASGIIGVAPSVNLYAVKTQAVDGVGTTSTLINGLDWAVNHHMHIVNMSFGTYDYSVAAERAVDDATTAGLVLVAASGNTGDRAAGEFNIPEYPAMYRNVISVGAVGPSRQSWASSTYNAAVDISAPGVNILTTVQSSAENPASYGCINGTSLAAPHVSGVLALVKERFPRLGVYDLKRQVVCSAVDSGAPGRDDHTGYGVVDALAALSSAVPSCPYLRVAEGAAPNPAPTPEATMNPRNQSPSDPYFDARIRSMAVTRVQTNGQARLMLTASVVNDFGNPVSSVTLDVQVESPTGQVFRLGTMTTDAQGVAQISLSGANCGTVVFRVLTARRANYQIRLDRSVTTAQFSFPNSP